MPKTSVDVEAWPSETLVAVVLGGAHGTGARAVAASEVGAQVLCDLGGIGGLSRASIGEVEEQLASTARIRLKPRAAALRIAAAFELGRRATHDGIAPLSVANSADVAAWASPRLSSLDHEELWLLALDGRSRLRASRCVARGGLHGMGVRAADPLRLALRAAASAFVLVHNHPSGDPTPSKEDITFTRRVAAAAAVVGTPLLDHIVVAREGFASVPFASEASSFASGGVEA